ncbi:MAG: hypothetical protein ABR530_00560, partial [Pyrinomonadaceae bacterium]
MSRGYRTSNMPFVAFLSIALLLAISFGCGPPSSSSSSTQDPSASNPGGIPELSKEVIDERINDARVFDVMPES